MTTYAGERKTLNIALLGASGRMGRSIIPLLAADAGQPAPERGA